MKTILIIDDEEDFCFFVRSNLESVSDYNIVAVNDGQKGLAAIKKIKPDLVLLDLIMPDISGFDILKKIRENKTLKSLPVLIVTAKDDEETKEQAKRLYASDFIVKPFEIDFLKSKIDNFLSN